MSTPFDVLVVGGGHAGCEAALAAARLGARTALLVADRSAIARMSCNPSIGGIAKSHMVHELDALGGEMPRNADYTGIQFRTLNTRKGPAVQATRAQSDKQWYPRRMQAVVAATPNLSVLEGLATEIWTANGSLRGVRLASGETIPARTVVITAGTFLRGLIHIGDESFAGGRMGETAAYGLSDSFEALGLRLARLKTGTPPRLLRSSIDIDRMVLQPGEEPPPLFSWQGRRDREMFHVEHSEATPPQPSGLFHVEQSATELRPWPPGSAPLACWLTHTTEVTHDIIRDALPRSALYGGRITGTGVRYCPSVEDKVVKFSEKTSHHVFVEPEGRDNPWVYPNGISNSLPKDVQVALVHSIPGLEQAELAQFAYAIEYDYSDPTQLTHTLECKAVESLFFAGQVNGTTGYEEAAVQGFVAGANAALQALGRPALVLAREDCYIGVLLDDLVTKGTDEPYRMFTSRAENRMALRQDNARFRLLAQATQLGLQPAAWVEETRRFQRDIDRERARLASTRLGELTLEQMLRRPETRLADLPSGAAPVHREVAEQIEILAKYEGYIQRDVQRAARLHTMNAQAIPDWVDYRAITALRYEAREKLVRIRPVSLGQAARIPGINPSDIAILAVVIRRGPTPDA